ncbi:MAG: trypsin-like peptidase domain-containing protein [Akkermansiaceae bacterium]|nr:trypsin-like peptidase domain-containing protein [Akkermansiaceae bacterium]
MHQSLNIILFTSLLILTGCLNSCNKGPKKFVAKDAEQGVVQIFAANEKGVSSGSGFYIGDNLIVTNWHVVATPNLKLLVAGRKNGKDSIELQDATVEWSDKELDMAIIQVPDIECDELTLSSAPIQKGSRAYAIGFPASASLPKESMEDFYRLLFSNKRGVIKDLDSSIVQILDPTVSSGEIRKTTKRKWFQHYSTKLEVIDHDVNIGHGNSGGPLLDECGRVIGINTAGLDAEVDNNLTLADNVKLSSSITELIKILERKDISANITSTPVEDILSDGFGWTTWLLLILILALAVYILVTLRNKPQSETIAQYAGRVSGYTKLQRARHKDQPVAAPHGPRWEGGKIVTDPLLHQAAPPPQPTPQTQSHSWMLQSDPSSAHHVQLPISEELLKQYGYNLTIGRKPGVAHLVIDNSSISKAHAILSFRKGNFAIIDQQSANGTRINGTPLNPGQRTRINPGDILTLGEVSVDFTRI